MPRQKAIGYCRVSTEDQEKKGFGLLAQKKKIIEFAERFNYELVEIYSEQKSGTIIERTLFKKAVTYCRENNATLIGTHADRLSRVAWYGLYLLWVGVKLRIVSVPFADNFTLGIFFIIAERDALIIRERTHEGMEAASEKGVKFGTGIHKTHAKTRRAYKQFGRKIRPTIAYYYSKGFTSVRRLKEILNKNRVKTFRGKSWGNASVHRLLKELKYL